MFLVITPEARGAHAIAVQIRCCPAAAPLLLLLLLHPVHLACHGLIVCTENGCAGLWTGLLVVGLLQLRLSVEVTGAVTPPASA
jgi:hypothetical protein